MKSLLCMVLVLAMCTGCELGTYVTNPGAQGNSGSDPTVGGNTTPSTPATGDGTVDANTPYTVALYYNNKPFEVPNAEQIQVVWVGESTNTVLPLNADGTANAGVLDGDFDIYLIGLPEEYSYNPNINHATADSRHVDIMIVDIAQPIKGDGGIKANPPSMAMYVYGGCFEVQYQGTYRVKITEPNQKFYFQYRPKTTGIYSVESWCNIYTNEVNPLMDVWKGEVGLKNLDYTLDDGGPSRSGGFTKNFRYEIVVENTGPTYTFGIYGYSDTNKVPSEENPIIIDFAITYEGAYDATKDQTVTVVSEEFNGLSKPQETSAAWNWANYLTWNADANSYDKVFRGADTAIRLNPDEGLYRLYDEERYADNDGWGPYLMCDLKNTPECYSVTSLYNANQAGGSANNFLKLRVWDETYQDYVRHDYTLFIRNQYADKCDSKGRCYVTEELRQFLQLYAQRHSLWTDGVGASEGSPEENGYSASQENMWLFACGFYEDGRPFV